MTTNATPNRVDARTIREALKATDLNHGLRITSGTATTYITGLTCPLTDERVDAITTALRPLWNDSEARIYNTDGFGSVHIRRPGWANTAPLDAELELLVAAIHPGRVRELREHSTMAERTAELSAALPVPAVLTIAGDRYRLAPADNDNRPRFPGTGVLEASHPGQAYERCTTVGLDPITYHRQLLIRQLLVRVDKMRRPVRHHRPSEA